MAEPMLREYNPEEYKADMEKLIKILGFKRAVKVYCDRINDVLPDDLPYGIITSIQEDICNILFLCDLKESVNESTEKIADGQAECFRRTESQD